MTREDAFFGAWRLVSYDARLADGSAVFPLGVGPTGLIIWASDGAFSAQISPGAAADGATDGGEPPYIAYYGRWEFDEAAGEVVHHVDGSASANMRATPQRRKVTFDGDRVTLTPPPTEIEGVRRTMSLLWERERQPDSEARD